MTELHLRAVENTFAVGAAMRDSVERCDEPTTIYIDVPAVAQNSAHALTRTSITVAVYERCVLALRRLGGLVAKWTTR